MESGPPGEGSSASKRNLQSNSTYQTIFNLIFFFNLTKPGILISTTLDVANVDLHDEVNIKK
jgi:hypothetical protein